MPEATMPAKPPTNSKHPTSEERSSGAAEPDFRSPHTNVHLLLRSCEIPLNSVAKLEGKA
jgi:hypothetical protein